ncbi:MAG: HIT family protein [Alphaproteobacteria bacterium]|nr:HIT family protein [Alphaproteobacteria bacterium]MDE1932322.1 HIT family protein [Alphaproteobacteria bacterium]
MQTDPNCIFCKIVAGQIPSFKLTEDAATLAFMDINPANEGHCLVIAKPHHPTLYDMPPELLAAVSVTALKVAKAVNAALKPDGLNLVQSNGPGAAQSVPHFHVHVLPRRLGDKLPLNWELKPGDRAAIAATAERIKAKL